MPFLFLFCMQQWKRRSQQCNFVSYSIRLRNILNVVHLNPKIFQAFASCRIWNDIMFKKISFTNNQSLRSYVLAAIILSSSIWNRNCIIQQPSQCTVICYSVTCMKFQCMKTLIEQETKFNHFRLKNVHYSKSFL